MSGKTRQIPRILVQLEGVLADTPAEYDPRLPGLPPVEPEPGTVEAIRRFQAEGFEVAVYSRRAETADGLASVQAWLRTWGFPSGLRVFNYIAEADLHFLATGGTWTYRENDVRRTQLALGLGPKAGPANLSVLSAEEVQA